MEQLKTIPKQEMHDSNHMSSQRKSRKTYPPASASSASSLGITVAATGAVQAQAG